MDDHVSKIMLFTLSACPMGRSMSDVLEEVQQTFPQIQFETVYVEIMADRANHYRIKKNPTTLFLDGQGNELYRMEAFAETDEIIAIIRKLNNGLLTSNRKYAENEATMESYTIYLFKNGELSPVDIEYKNRTGIPAPRITALNLLLHSHLDRFENPFPPSSTLELVNFDQKRAEISIYVNEGHVDERLKRDMQQALLKTLAHFGIEEVKLEICDKASS